MKTLAIHIDPNIPKANNIYPIINLALICLCQRKDHQLYLKFSRAEKTGRRIARASVWYAIEVKEREQANKMSVYFRIALADRLWGE